MTPRRPESHLIPQIPRLYQYQVARDEPALRDLSGDESIAIVEYPLDTTPEAAVLITVVDELVKACDDNADLTSKPNAHACYIVSRSKLRATLQWLAFMHARFVVYAGYWAFVESTY